MTKSNKEMNYQPHIKIKALRVSFSEAEVLHGISFTANKGEFITIVGKSGCGKSSLLHALAGFIDKTGDIHMPLHVGIVFQSYAVFPWLTVKGNIEFGLQGTSVGERKAITSSLIDLVGLTNDAHKYPFQLSGGQTQRVALARALAPNPEVILMDEPFGALDMFTREKMQKWLLDLWERDHKTVIFVTHDIDEALFLSDRLLVMGNGVIIDELHIPFMRPRDKRIKLTSEFIELKRLLLEQMEST